jgi:uncharacterized protein
VSAVFIDTSAFLAVLIADDAQHCTAQSVFERLLQTQSDLVTHNYVILETFSLLQSRVGIDAARVFAQELLPIASVEWVRPEDHDIGIGAVLTASRRRLSLVDCVSFALLRRTGITEVFAFDRYFAEQGFHLLKA